MLGSVSDQFDESLRVVYTYCEMFSRDFMLGAKKRCMSNTSRWSPISSEHSNISLSDVTLPEDSWPNGTRNDMLQTPPAIPFISKIDACSAPSRWTYQSEDNVTRRSPVYVLPEDDYQRVATSPPPPPLPPRQSIGTQTICNTASVAVQSTSPGLRTENSRFINPRQAIFDATDVVINTSTDYATCSNADAAISRVVRIRGDFEIAALSGVFVPTQILYPSLSTRCECCTTRFDSSEDNAYHYMCRIERVYSSITMLGNDHWLSKISRDVLRVKEGIVSKYFAGRLNLCVFNNANYPVKVLSGSPIALHTTRVVPYCS